MTGDDLRNEFKLLHEIGSGVAVYSDSQFNTEILRAYERIVNRMDSAGIFTNYTESSITLVAETLEYDLPSTLRKIIKIYQRTLRQEIRLVDPRTFPDEYPEATAWHDRGNSKLRLLSTVFTPETYELWYSPRPTITTPSTDSPDLVPVEFHQIIVYEALITWGVKENSQRLAGWIRLRDDLWQNLLATYQQSSSDPEYVRHAVHQYQTIHGDQ